MIKCKYKENTITLETDAVILQALFVSCAMLMSEFLVNNNGMEDKEATVISFDPSFIFVDHLVSRPSNLTKAAHST